jgi:hypothetical protein
MGVSLVSASELVRDYELYYALVGRAALQSDNWVPHQIIRHLKHTRRIGTNHAWIYTVSRLVTTATEPYWTTL